MEQRPKIRIQPSPIDRIISATSLILFAATWLIPLVAFTQLPDQVPIHFNAQNQADGYGSKATLFVIPAIATFVFALLTIVGKRPEALNYAVAITKENAAFQYQLATRTLRILLLVTMAVFVAITLQTVSREFHNVMGAWLLPITIAMIFAPVTYLIVKSVRSK